MLEKRLTKLQLAMLKRDDPQAALEYAAKKKAKKRESGTKEKPNCNAGNYACGAGGGARSACIPQSRPCKYDPEKDPNPKRKQWIEDQVSKLKQAGSGPQMARFGRKLGAPSVAITPDQYRRALMMGLSGQKLSQGDATPDQLKALGIRLDGRKPAEKPTNDIVPLDGTRSAKARLNDETRPEVLREIAKNSDDPELQKAASDLLRSMDATDKALGDMKGLVKPKTKLQQVIAEKDAALRLDPKASDFEMVDNSAIRGLGDGDPDLANLIKRAGMTIKPSVLTPDGMGEDGEMFRVVAGGDVADAAARAYREERSPQLELAAAIVTNNPDAAKRQADLLEGDTGWNLPRGAMAPDLTSLGGNVQSTNDTTTSGRMFSFNHSDITAPKNSFDPQEIDSIAREILRSGGLVQPIPLVQTGRATAAADASFEPIAGFKAYAAAQRARELDPNGAEMFRGVVVDPNNAAEIDQVRRFYGTGKIAEAAATKMPETPQKRVAAAIGQIRLGSMPQDELDQLNTLILGSSGNFRTRTELLDIAEEETGSRQLPKFLDNLSDEELVMAMDKMERPIANEYQKREDAQPGGTVPTSSVNEMLDIIRLMRPS